MSPRSLFIPCFIVAALAFVPALRADLVIYYPLDETSGNTANDAAGTGGVQNASATAAANWQISSGILGGAVRFSPTAQADVDEALIYNSASAILATTPFTITLWLNTADATAFNHAAVFFGNSGASFDYYAVGTTSTTPQMIARSASANIATLGTSGINNAGWHQIAAVYNGTASRSLYVDGKLVGSSSTAVAHPTTNRFALGALMRSGATDSFSGMLDEVGLFDTAFSAPQAALLNAFPRYDSVRLDDNDYALALSVFNTQAGSVNTGNWTWSYATGLTGNLGTTGFSGGNPFVVLDSSGNGLSAIPEPGTSVLALVGLAGFIRRRNRK